MLRILLSIGPAETCHFQTWQDKAGNAVSTPLAPLTDPTNGLTFPDLNSPPFGGEDFQTNLIMPEPCPFLSTDLPVCSIIRPTETTGAAMSVFQVFDRDGSVHRAAAVIRGSLDGPGASGGLSEPAEVGRLS